MEKIEKQLEAARQQLLDLTMRNRLLNYRPSKINSLKVVDEIAAEIYDILVIRENIMEFQAAKRGLEEGMGGQIEDLDVLPVDADPTADPLDIDVIINELNLLNLNAGGVALSSEIFNPVLHDFPVTVMLYNVANFNEMPSYQDFSRAIALIAVHEISHELSLVDQYNLIGDSGSHLNPNSLLFSLEENIMDQSFNPYQPIIAFRDFCITYLSTILKTLP